MLNSSSYVFLWFLKDKTLAFFQKCCSEAFRKDGGDQEFGGRGFSGTLEAQMFKSSAHVFFSSVSEGQNARDFSKTLL